MSGKNKFIGASVTINAGFKRATLLAFCICGMLTFISLVVPPALNFDPGIGLLEWRTLSEGGPANTLTAPDRTDISKDRLEFVTWWSPGQYLIPGAFTRLGLPLGPALSLVAGFSLLTCLLGWLRVLRHFGFSPQAGILTVVFLSAFQYSTLNFRIYIGGEILLQAVTPWLILAGCYVPNASALRSAAVAALAIFIGFFVKLTGLMVASAALTTGCFLALIHNKRITSGMVASAFGTLSAFGILYAAWFSRGATPGSGAGWVFQIDKVVFAAIGPWGAGLSWMDTWSDIWYRHPSTIAWFVLPPAIFFASVFALGSRGRIGGRIELSEFTKYTLCFYAIYAVAMEGLYLHGGYVSMQGGMISIDERHLRSAGTLIFVCALGIADRLPRKNAIRYVILISCGAMSLVGIWGFAERAWKTNLAQVDSYSRTHQLKVDVGALAYARAEFAREGRSALFVIPFPDAASAFPPGARLLLAYLDVESQAYLAARKYAGRVHGHIYIILPTRLARSEKGVLLLHEFTDYPSSNWETREFGHTTVLTQEAPAS